MLFKFHFYWAVLGYRLEARTFRKSWLCLLLMRVAYFLVQVCFADNASSQLQLCLRLEDPGYTQNPLSVYDPKTHPICLHPGERDKSCLELSLPFPG